MHKLPSFQMISEPWRSEPHDLIQRITLKWNRHVKCQHFAHFGKTFLGALWLNISQSVDSFVTFLIGNSRPFKIVPDLPNVFTDLPKVFPDLPNCNLTFDNFGNFHTFAYSNQIFRNHTNHEILHIVKARKLQDHTRISVHSRTTIDRPIVCKLQS